MPERSKDEHARMAPIEKVLVWEGV